MDATKPDDPATAYADAAAAMLGLTIRGEWRDRVLLNLALLADAAALVVGAPLDDDIEVAPVFAA